jgi:hypothetical protein
MRGLRASLFLKRRIDMKVNGVWYLDLFPEHAIVEFEDGSFAKFFITPFRNLKSGKDFTVYEGYHPRKCKGQPLPAYMYKFYGLEKNDEAATEVIHIRLTPTEKTKIEDAAKNAGKNISEHIRDYIRSL